MNWSRLADASWTDARTKQWIVALVTTRRTIYTSKITPSELSQLRGAWEMYCFLRSNRPGDARRLRKQYEYRRFYELYRKWAVHEFDADTCIEYLEFDGSIAAMVEQVEDIHSPYEEWERRGQSIYKTVDKFTHVAYGAPEWFTNWAADTKQLFERHGIK